MIFSKDDILIRNNSTIRTVWVSQNLLLNTVDVSDAYLRRIRSAYKKSVQPCHRHHNILPDTGKSWRYAKINGSFYYDLKALPNRKPNMIRDLFGDAETLLTNYNDYINNSVNNDLERHFKHYLKKVHKIYIQSYINNTAVQQKSLAIACALLEGAIKWIDDNEIPLNKSAFFKEYCALLEKYDIRYLPHNYRNFKQKIDEVLVNKTPIVEVIYLPRQWNSNALLHVDEIVKSWAIQLRSMGQNYSNDSIVRKIREMCQITGKPMPSRRWFGQNIFEKHHTKFLTAVTRFGSGERGANLYEGYVPVSNAIFAGDCWHVDATRMQLIAHKTDNGNLKHLFVVAVRDVHSGDILGYNFDYKEDRWSVLNAVKMAVIEAGYLPYEIVFDRFPGHNTQEAQFLFAQLEQMGVKVTISHSPQAKAKLERWFGTMQSVFAESSEYYYGEGIKSKRLHAHRSPEYLKAVRKKALKDKFDLQDAWRESQLICEAYRITALSYYSRKHKAVNKSPKQLHSESEKPHVKFVEDWQISMLFGLKKKLQMKNHGLLKTEIQGAEFYYKIEEYDVISKVPEVIVSYDLNDLSSVFVFKKKDKFLVYLCEAKEFNKPQIYGAQAEFNKVAQEKARIKAIDAQRAKELAELTESNGFNEVSLLMGKYTQKDEATTAETIYLNENNDVEDKLIKKAVGSDISTSDSFEFDIDQLVQSQI